MDEKQRIKDAIKFNETDKIPWQINYTNGIARKVMEDHKLKENKNLILGKNVSAYNNLDNYFGNHIKTIAARALDSSREIKKNLWEDEWGVIWDRSVDKDIGIPINYPLKDQGLNDLKIPDPDQDERYLHFDPIIEEHSNRYILARLTYNIFERAWSLRGMENLMMDFVQNPSLVHELFGIICDFFKRIIPNLGNFKVDGLLFGDDWGGQNGLLINPNMWREFIKPYISDMYDLAHSHNFDVFIHSCGDISAILEDLVETGVDVFNPFQPEVMYVGETMKKYSKRLAFYGSLSLQKTLPFGTPEQVIGEIENRLELASIYKGLIISPSHSMTPDIPVENIDAMVNRLKENI